MNTSFSLVREDFGTRTLVRRVLLPNSVDSNALLVLVEYLNDFPPLPKKKNFISLAGGKATFSCCCYGSQGYVFEGKLEQVRVKGQSYLFADPYKEAEELFSSFFVTPFTLNEKYFAVAKERVLSSLLFAKKDSEKNLLSLLKVRGETPLGDEVRLKELKSEEVTSLLPLVASKKCGDIFLLSSSEKEKPLLDFYESPLKISDEKPEAFEKYGDYDSDTSAYLFSMKPIKDTSSLLLFSLFEEEFLERANLALSRVLGSKLHLSLKLVSASQFLLLLEGEEGKISYLGKNNPFEPYVSFEEKAKEEKKDTSLLLISLLKDKTNFLDLVSTAFDLNLHDAGALLKKEEFEDSKIEEIFASLKEEASFRLWKGETR